MKVDVNTESLPADRVTTVGIQGRPVQVDDRDRQSNSVVKWRPFETSLVGELCVIVAASSIVISFTASLSESLSSACSTDLSLISQLIAWE